MLHRPLNWKLLVVAGFSFVWFLIALGRIDRPVALRLDVDCVMGLAATFQQGSISGRDFQYTYGPVAQLLAWAGAALQQRGSAFDGFGLSVLVWYATAILLFAAIVLCIPDLRPLDCFLLYLGVVAFDLLAYYPFTDVASFRVLMVLLAVVAAARSLASETPSHRRIWGAVAGALCVIGQLTTIELGLQAVAAILLLTLLWALLSRLETGQRFQPGHWETAALVLGIFVGGNFLVSGVFWISSPSYSFLDYQRYAWETIASYVYGSQLPWDLGVWRTLGLAAIALYTYAAVWLIRERLGRRARAVVFGLACASLFCLKNTLVRSDVTHIKAGMTPVLFLFLLLGRWTLPQLRKPLEQWKAPAAWLAVLVVAWLCWPNNAASATDLFDGARALAAGELGAMRRSQTSPAALLPPEVLAAVRDSGARPMLNFPFEDHVAALLNRRLVAPVLQSFAANTVGLQRYYVNRLERPRNQQLEVTYNVDDLSAWPVDGAQTITRLPLIFDYLLRNFRLSGGTPAMLVLRRQNPPREIEFNTLSFQTSRQDSSVHEIRLNQPTDCGLIRLDLRVDYPGIASLLKPARLAVQVLHGEQSVVETNLIPLARGAPFYVFVNAAPPQQFFKYFTGQAVSGPQWDRLIVERKPGDKLEIGPDLLQIDRLSCVDATRFAVAVPGSGRGL